MQDTAAHCGSEWPISICSCRLCLSASCLVSCLQINNQDTSLLTRTLCTINTTTCIFRGLTWQWRATFDFTHYNWSCLKLAAICSFAWNFPKVVERKWMHTYSFLLITMMNPHLVTKRSTSPHHGPRPDWLFRQGHGPGPGSGRGCVMFTVLKEEETFLTWPGLTQDTRLRHSDTRSRLPELRRSTSHCSFKRRFSKIS